MDDQKGNIVVYLLIVQYTFLIWQKKHLIIMAINNYVMFSIIMFALLSWKHWTNEFISRWND